VYLAFVGAALCVLVFTVLQIVSGKSKDLESTPEIQVLPEAEDISVPQPKPLVVQPPKTMLKVPPQPAKPKAVAPVVAPRKPKRVKAPVVNAPAPVVKKAPPQALAESGLVSISSWPKSKVYVDGVYLQDSPLNRHALPVGKHSIRLLTEDGRVHQFEVESDQGRPVKRIWHFDEKAWIE
jgi:hypothetical protein